MLAASELLSYPKDRHLVARLHHCILHWLHSKKIRVSNLNPRGSARDRAQWAWMVAVRGIEVGHKPWHPRNFDQNNRDSLNSFSLFIHLFISHWQLRIYFTPSLQCIWVSSSEATMAMANIWLVSSANMARASNGRRPGKLQVYKSLRKIMQRVWKIKRDTKIYPSKIPCFH